MKRASVKYFSLLLLVTCVLYACGDDFDENTDSAMQTISVSVNPQGWYDEVLLLTDDGCEIRKAPLTTDEKHLLRITGFCYNNNDSLLATNEVLSSDVEKVELKFQRIHRTEYCHIVVLADVVRRDYAAGYEENWVFLSRDKFSELTILSMEPLEPSSYNALYAGYIDVIPANQRVELDMQKVSINGYFKISTRTPYEEFYGNIKYPCRFSAKTFENTTLQGREFRAPADFEGDILFPVSATIFGENISISYYTQNKLYKKTTQNHSLYNKGHRPFLISVDCTEGCENPVNYQTF